jgi:metal-responsive CopG/Arc/MetJ family transcriptional regulator
MTKIPAEKSAGSSEVTYVSFTIRLPQTVVDDIDSGRERLSAKLGFAVSRNDMITRILRTSIDEARAKRGG